jgi:hypothetical protein
LAKSKAEILSQCKRRYIEVDGVRLQSLTEWEMSNLRSRWHSRMNKQDDSVLALMTVDLLAVCIVDEEGNRLFSDKEAGELKSLDSKFAQRLNEACRIHCGLDDDGSEVDDLEKKSEEAEESN